MVDLNKWAFDHRFYLKLEDKKPVICKLVGYEEFIDHEQEDREKIRYHLLVGGSEKVLESQSTKLAEEMAKIKKGDWISLTREGKGRSTSYTVEKVPPPDEGELEVELDKEAKKVKGKKK